MSQVRRLSGRFAYLTLSEVICESRNEAYRTAVICNVLVACMWLAFPYISVFAQQDSVCTMLLYTLKGPFNASMLLFKYKFFLLPSRVQSGFGDLPKSFCRLTSLRELSTFWLEAKRVSQSEVPHGFDPGYWNSF